MPEDRADAPDCGSLPPLGPEQPALARLLADPGVDTAELVAAAWELCYLDAVAAREIGRALIERGGAALADGWFHVALGEVRFGDAVIAADATKRARQAYREAGDARGVAMCDEIRGIELRRAGDLAGSAALQAALDAQQACERDPLHAYLAHNSRAITCKHLGLSDAALEHFYAASDAALRTGWAGPRITAACNLGGYHQTLFNLDDARQLSEEALSAARQVGARQAVGVSAKNLIIVYYAAGDFVQARAMAEFMLSHPDELLPGELQRSALQLAMGHLAVGEIDAAMGRLEGGAVKELGQSDGQTQWTWLTARCLMARGDAQAARRIAETTLAARQHNRLEDEPYDLMQLYSVLADACEAGGDAAAALRHMRGMHAVYEKLVGRSARARFIAIQVSHHLAEVQRERDLALDSRRSAEDDRMRLVQLNRALQAQIAETEMLHAKLREQALRDPLTGLHNRRYLFEIGPGLIELARRQGGQLCVVLMDLDHFKLLNDTYGHQAGDLVLQRFSGLLTQILRRSDVVCRHGGEEFVAVMPDIDGDGAQQVINRLLESFHDLQLEIGRRRLPRGAFSAGIAQFPRHGNTLEQLLMRADRGLYAAKNHGRARVEMAPRTGFGTLT
ncbi:MAG: diguanylate cyclase [Burkholderiales bacterium]|nr:diguanylate cyclase [Burkholderiales bacterium]